MTEADERQLGYKPPDAVCNPGVSHQLFDNILMFGKILFQGGYEKEGQRILKLVLRLINALS